MEILVRLRPGSLASPEDSADGILALRQSDGAKLSDRSSRIECNPLILSFSRPTRLPGGLKQLSKYIATQRDVFSVFHYSFGNLIDNLAAATDPCLLKKPLELPT